MNGFRRNAKLVFRHLKELKMFSGLNSNTQMTRLREKEGERDHLTALVFSIWS